MGRRVTLHVLGNFERLEDVENDTNTTEEEVEEVIPHIMAIQERLRVLRHG
jgi:hypothetical protein